MLYDQNHMSDKCPYLPRCYRTSELKGVLAKNGQATTLPIIVDFLQFNLQFWAFLLIKISHDTLMFNILESNKSIHSLVHDLSGFIPKLDWIHFVFFSSLRMNLIYSLQSWAKHLTHNCSLGAGAKVCVCVCVSAYCSLLLSVCFLPKDGFNALS